ncbi:MAG: precorrin-3B C(17)-methyltransferase, partial [Peptostreptococcaceae bacterium]|nr:precorrin-3B C(17)-methyltransferase [Peptostreptococcaceae bacterium]
KTVAVISSGDAGIYGMAGLILELTAKEKTEVPVKVVPGVTASIGAAAILGAPIMHDFCHISLSDLLTPWEVIEKRLRLAAEADFVVCLYNPRSKGRSEHLAKAFEIMGEFKDGSIPVGIVKDVGRENEEKFLCTFDTMDFERVDMTTMVIIGNKSTFIDGDKMITPRGYTV